MKTISVSCLPHKRQYETNSKKGRVLIEEVLVQHGLVQFRNFVFWRGARITPNFPT